MSLEKLNFTRRWTSAADFPTFEEDEAQVRADMQCLFDEIRDYLNALVDALQAQNLPFDPSPGVDSVTVQNAIENVQAQIAAVAVGQLPAGSVGSTQLGAGAVGSAALAAGAVTGEKLAEASVGAEALSPGSVCREALAAGSVGTEQLAEGCITAEKLDAAVLAPKADLVEGRLEPRQRALGWLALGADTVLQPAHAGKLLYFVNTAPVTLTLPRNSAAEIPTGTELELLRGDGPVTLAAEEGVTLLCATSGRSLAAPGARLRLKKLQANLWAADGELTERTDTAALAPACVTAEKLAPGALQAAAVQGVLSPAQGGTGVQSLAAALCALLAAGPMVLGAAQHGTELPETAAEGTLFFLEVGE